LQTTYEAAAELGGWDRSRLECDPNRLLPLSMRRSAVLATDVGDTAWRGDMNKTSE
jgi:hypothetical protein